MRLTLLIVISSLSLLALPSLAILSQSTCTIPNYFDTTYLDCTTCQANASPNTQYSCKCNSGYYYSQQNVTGWKGTCTQCDSTSAPSGDLRRCVTCSGTKTTAGECQCTTGQIAYDVDISGTLLTTKACITCASGAYPDPAGRGCARCPQGMIYSSTTGACTCNTAAGYITAGDGCVSSVDVASLGTAFQLNIVNRINYGTVEGSGVPIDGFVSGTVEYYYYKSAIGCINYKDPQSCQAFANLCVLTAYDENAGLCRLFLNSLETLETQPRADSNFKVGMPWLFYGNNALSVINNAGIQLTVTLGKGAGSEVSKFNFFLTRYDINGTYLGTSTLSNQLLVCPSSVQAGDTLKTFGTSFITSCMLDLSLFETATTVFYEMWMRDSDNSVVDIPVKVTNLRLPGGGNPNLGDVTGNTQFTRRFFVIDTLSGISSLNDFKNRAVPAVLRFAKIMKLIISVRESDSTKINRPYLEIEYGSKQTQTLATNSTTYASFQTEYKMNISSFWTTVTILFIIANILAGIIALFKSYVWTRFNPYRFNVDSWALLLFFRFIINLMKAWADVMFFFLFFISGYWFIFYKMQNTVYFLVPNEDLYPTDFVAFRVVFGLMVSFQILWTLNMIREQVEMDFFFIDWEKPKLMYKREVNQEVYLQSAWRMILVANEFNELQVSRYYPIELLYMIFGFFMIGLRWEQFAAIVPALTTTVDDGIPRNVVLKFFLGIFLLFVIGMILYGLRRAITLKVPSSVQEFTDLCSIANVSLMVFDKQFHGYYLHGMAPSGQAEGSIGDLKRALDLESKGTVRGRGLLANDPSNLQTYEIFLPYEARMAYNNLYKSEITKEIYTRQAAQQVSGQIQLKVMNKALPQDFDFKRMEGRRLVIQEHLKLYIEGVKVESGKLIRDKTPFMRFFDIPPVDIETLQGNPLFYKDPGYGFQKTVFYGNEFSLLITDICIYTMWDIIVQNTFIAIFLSYFTNKLIAFLRVYFGERNISQKALIDEAFLI